MQGGEVRRYPPLNDILGRFTPAVYIGPTLVLVVVFLIYPLFNVFRFSTFDWSGLGKQTFIGLKNYLDLARDNYFWMAFRANAIYVIFFSLVPSVLGILLASLIGRSDITGERIFRGILLTPQVLASVAMGVIFGWVFAPGFGVLNSLLALVGLSNWQLPWLGSQVWTPISIGLVGTWLWIGFTVIVFYSGMKKIEESLYDSAKMDGAGPVRQLVSITLPQLRSEIVVVVVMTLIWAFGSSVFGIVYAITKGGYGSTPMALYAYQLAFVQARMGYGSAVIVVLMLLIVAVSAITFRVGEGRRQ